jgi:hypothetical protein
VIQPFAIRSERLYTPGKPVRDEGYKRFIRKLPCIVCGRNWRIEAAHFGPHGIGQKSSDLQTLPLCYQCHQTGTRSYHRLGPVEFAAVHNLDIPGLILKLNQFYREHLEAA